MRKYGFYAAMFGIVCMAGFLIYDKDKPNEDNVSQIKLAQESQGKKEGTNIERNTDGGTDIVDDEKVNVDTKVGSVDHFDFDDADNEAGVNDNASGISGKDGAGGGTGAGTGADLDGGDSNNVGVGNEASADLNGGESNSSEVGGEASVDLNGGASNRAEAGIEDEADIKDDDVSGGTADDSASKRTVNVSALAYSFDQEKGIAWPVKGDILLKYSVDEPVYYETLQSFMTNEGVIIEANEGDAIKCGCDGVITNVYESDRYGNMMDISIGDDYTITYGQLKNIRVQVGDDVLVNQDIADVASPTSFFENEGPNVYMEIREKDETVDPLLLLE